LREPVWSAIERIAAKLIESGKLSAAEALAAVGGDAATLHPLMSWPGSASGKGDFDDPVAMSAK
jgi:hypothetical protein